MNEKENKVQFNIKNMHYAVLNMDGDTPSWAKPVGVPGTVNLNLSASGNMEPFYADGIVYYKTTANNGYQGDLQMARFIDQMLQDIWGYELEPVDKVMIEKASVEPKPFALLFQIDGDAGNDLYLLYNCTGTRPAIAGATSTETKTPKTQSSTISATPLEYNDFVFARTTEETPDSVREKWFTAVYMPGQTTGAESQ